MKPMKIEPTVCCIEFCAERGFRIAQRMEPDLSISRLLLCRRHFVAYQKIEAREYREGMANPAKAVRFAREGERMFRVQ